MELKPLPQLLEDMLYEAGDDGLEVCLAEAVCEAELDRAALHAEYDLRYGRAIAAITEHRGSPTFTGQRGDPGYPEWMRLERASYWSDAAGIIYVGLSETPLGAKLYGGGRPHPVRPQAITLLPSAG